jgi:starch synthase
MHVLFASAEVAPLIKTGGLADVAGALPAMLRTLGCDARIVMPRYQRLRERPHQEGPLYTTFLPLGDRQELMQVYLTHVNETPIYLLDIPAAFDRPAIYGDADDDARFILFCRGIMALMLFLRDIQGWRTDVLHANDWHTGLVPNYIKTFYAYTFRNVATVYTIHNIGYQGLFSSFTQRLAGVESQGENFINFMARGITHTDIVTTVSPTYAREILTEEYGERMNWLLAARSDRLVGLLNGVDYTVFDPATDPYLAANYSADDPNGKAVCKAALQSECGLAVDANRPLLAMVSRLAEQKGIDLLDAVIPWLMYETDAQLVVLGTGQPHWEWVLTQHAANFPDRIFLRVGFDAALAQRIYAASDMFLMPSRYEPGGLGQLIALRYGSVPIVRATGGLNDTIREGYDGNGFRFHPYETSYFRDAIGRALATYRDARSWSILRERGMREDYSWGASARSYMQLYEWAIQMVR